MIVNGFVIRHCDRVQLFGANKGKIRNIIEVVDPNGSKNDDCPRYSIEVADEMRGQVLFQPKQDVMLEVEEVNKIIPGKEGKKDFLLKAYFFREDKSYLLQYMKGNGKTKDAEKIGIVAPPK